MGEPSRSHISSCSLVQLQRNTEHEAGDGGSHQFHLGWNNKHIPAWHSQPFNRLQALCRENTHLCKAKALKMFQKKKKKKSGLFLGGENGDSKRRVRQKGSRVVGRLWGCDGR